jgi:hypothetical protein
MVKKAPTWPNRWFTGASGGRDGSVRPVGDPAVYVLHERRQSP